MAGAGFRHASYEFDGTRPVLGNMVGSQPEGPLSNLTDVQGFSHAGFGTLEHYHAMYPNKPMFESECCSCNTQRGENIAISASASSASSSPPHGALAAPKPFEPAGVQPSFNAPCLATQTNASLGVPWMAGSMVWTLFDYYGEPSFGGWPHVSSTFGAFDLAGFAKPAVWWYKSFWLYQVPDSSAAKPFATEGEHTIRIVESWEPLPVLPPTPPSNVTDVTPCSDTLPGQHIVFTGTRPSTPGQLKDRNGLCMDATCTGNMSKGDCNEVDFRPCVAGAATQQWTYTALGQFASAGPKGGCLNVWDGGQQNTVGLYTCPRAASPNVAWRETARGFQTLAPDPATGRGRCLTNGDGGGPPPIAFDIHVYSDLPSVELLVNGASAGTQQLLNPGLTPTATAMSWADFPSTTFVPGNLTAIGRDAGGVVKATHTMFTSGAATAIVLSIDAPSVTTGTGSALLLDGQDAGLIRASVVDAAGRVVAGASHNVTFTVVRGPGRVVGAHNGNPTCHEPNQVAWHSAYHGLVRAVVMVTEDQASPAWHRARLHEIDVDAGARTTTIQPADQERRDHDVNSDDRDRDRDPIPIVLRATAPDLAAATIEIPTTSDPAAGVMQTAAASAGKPVHFD